MKLTSKSILSPSHSREAPQMSLSSSSFNNRRLVSSNSSSTKGTGQASPMFQSGGKKRGPGGIENPEPSSPKVTCIGQVRVKTRKQGKKMRARSKRRGGKSSIGEASFRKSQQNHLQVGVNPDLSRQKSQKKNHVFQHQQEGLLPHSRNQRWVHVPVAICEALKAFGSEFNCFFTCRSSCTKEKEVKSEAGGSGGGHHREGSCGGDSVARWLVTLQEDNNNSPERSHRRRHVFEDIDIVDIEKLKNDEEEEEKGRVSICIPPKNALLLMRCRSDPVKVAALANRFWEPTIQKEDEEQEELQMEEDKESGKGLVFVASEEEAKATNLETSEVAAEKTKLDKEEEDVIADKNKNVNFSGAAYADEEKVKGEENDVVQSYELSSSTELPAPSEPQNDDVAAAKGSTEEEKGSKERESEMLPDCLLLMMCEPKLSMEVSRETWVCTADFVRCMPSRPPGGKHGGGDCLNKKKSSAAAESKPPMAPPHPAPSIQPARSSCSYPAPPVVGSNGFEPLALTRCKSEPRKGAARLAPEGCSWNNRKLMEPHPPARLGF